MRKTLFTFWVIWALTSCDSGGNTTNTPTYIPPSSDSQPTTRTVNCGYCNGGGVVLNPYDGNYYYCQNCGGAGKVTITTNSNPSFGAKGGRNSDCPRCTHCPGWEKKSTYNSDCKYCTHPKYWHYSQQ